MAKINGRFFLTNTYKKTNVFVGGFNINGQEKSKKEEEEIRSFFF
jgi:hypothetical protein